MGRVPGWYKSKQVECTICGFWYGERDSRIRVHRGKIVCKWCDDVKTTLEMEQERNIRR